jgi:hypothetical protein
VAFKQVSDLTSGSPGTDVTAALVSDGVELGRRLIFITRVARFGNTS